MTRLPSSPSCSSIRRAREPSLLALTRPAAQRGMASAARGGSSGDDTHFLLPRMASKKLADAAGDFQKKSGFGFAELVCYRLGHPKNAAQLVGDQHGNRYR